MKDKLRIGELAQRVGMRTSAIRYYERRGLVRSPERSAAGYRLYAPEVETTLRFIQRAQRIGFSLDDIQTLLEGRESGALSEAALLRTAEARYLELERKVTQLLVRQHELELTLQDLREGDGRDRERGPGSLFDRLVDRVCANPLIQSSEPTLSSLLEQIGCGFSTEKAMPLLDTLRGQHVHIWEEGDAYHILVVSKNTLVGDALEALAELEADCEVHTFPADATEMSATDEGFLFVARGENAFYFARLFLALQREV